MHPRDTSFAQVLCDGATLKNHQKFQAISLVFVRPVSPEADHGDRFDSGVKETVCIGFKSSPSNTASDVSNLVLEHICLLLDVRRKQAQGLINSVVTDHAAMSTGAAMKPHEIIAACKYLRSCCARRAQPCATLLIIYWRRRLHHASGAKDWRIRNWPSRSQPRGQAGRWVP